MGNLHEVLLFSRRVDSAVTDENYMARAYSRSTNSLYSHTIFRFIADEIKKSSKPIHILDLGCADGRSRQLLTYYGVQIAHYFGVDCNSTFSPSLVSDIRNVKSYMGNISFIPNIVLITDVLEHLENGAEDILKFLEDLDDLLPSDCKIFISAPQMYRLDRFKFKHLYYSEHRVRFHLNEWKEILSRNLKTTASYGIGYISVLPYLVMVFPWYNEIGPLGQFFKKFRAALSKSTQLRMIEYRLSKFIGGVYPLQTFSNSVLLVCKPKKTKLSQE